MKQILNTKGLALSMLTLALTACGGGSGDDKTPDTAGGKTPDIVTPAPEPQNAAPEISATQDLQVTERDMFSFTAEVSDSNGSIESFVWEQTAGTTVELSGTDTDTVEFVAPDITEDETITLKLSVTDNDDATTSQEFVIAINAYAQPSESVITDKALLACLNNAQLDMGATAIECIDAPIKSLSGLEKLSNLVSIKLENTKLENIDTLSSLVQLESLALRNNPVTDYSAINSLSLLKSLAINIKDNAISPSIDFSYLQNLTSFTLQYENVFNYNDFDLSALPTSLTELHLARLGTHSASALSSLSHLEKLSLEHVGSINSLSFLTNMSNMKEIAFASLNVNDPSAFALTPNLEKLSLLDTNISDLSFVAHLSKLTSLKVEFDYASSDRLFDISSIKELSGLTELSLHGILLENISSLNALSELHTLSLYNNNLNSLSFLKDLTQLVSLEIGENPQIIDVAWLAFLPALTDLTLDSLDYNVSYEVVSELTSLTKLRLEHRYLEGSFDLESISKFDQLEQLSIKIGQLTNIEQISNFTELQSLSINTNNLIALPSISELTKLHTLNLTNNSYYYDEGPTNFDELGSSSSLKSLIISGFNNNNDLNALSQFSALEELEIRSSKADSITPVSQLEKLKKLTLSGFHELNHVNELSKLNNLEFLNIFSSNSLLCADLETLRTTFEETASLHLPSSCIEILVDLDAIADENLREYIRSNRYFDALSLEHLSIDNSISSLEGIEQYTNLRRLTLTSSQTLNLVNSVDMSQLTNLGTLTFYYSQLSTLRGLSLPETITEFNVENNSGILDLDGFEAPHVTNLSFEWSELTNTHLLANFTNVSRLNLSHTRISDLTPLYSLTQLERLSIYQHYTYECSQIDGLVAALPNTYISKYSHCN
ncbi:PKD domain-containing protein [Pseudoalteromonas byunsanensis]|uniref:Uncharacterized protein n=1 Tax=Pseudoalteromonas byunsanensis TaxID=327939 RepID=A0A1S1NF48_9GAMM|nr:leucine-rich repeat domain-containing protein [Pseudoalteromonas byunsanensis]OHU97026.1 hypothetical protein BIW53_03310 [Pseudoalteromonas byunsanensis]